MTSKNGEKTGRNVLMPLETEEERRQFHGLPWQN